MQAAKTFQDLIVWPKAHAFALPVYGRSKGFVKDERYGFISQLRCAVVFDS